MPPGEAIKALQGEFRPEVLTALREMALRRVAEHCDRRLVAYMSTARINEPWEARPGSWCWSRPSPAGCRHPACRRPRRPEGRRLTAVSVRRAARSDDEKRLLGGYATLTHQLGGEFVTSTATTWPPPSPPMHAVTGSPRSGDAERPQQQLQDPPPAHPADGRRGRARRRRQRRVRPRSPRPV